MIELLTGSTVPVNSLKMASLGYIYIISDDLLISLSPNLLAIWNSAY